MDWLKHSDWLTPLDLAVLFVSLFCVWEMCSLCDGQHTNHKQYKRMMKILIWKVKLNLPTSEKREYFRATQRSLYLSRCLFQLQKTSGVLHGRFLPPKNHLIVCRNAQMEAKQVFIQMSVSFDQVCVCVRDKKPKSCSVACHSASHSVCAVHTFKQSMEFAIPNTFLQMQVQVQWVWQPSLSLVDLKVKLVTHSVDTLR